MDLQIVKSLRSYLTSMERNILGNKLGSNWFGIVKTLSHTLETTWDKSEGPNFTI